MINLRQFGRYTKTANIILMLSLLVLSLCSAQTNRHITDERVLERFNKVIPKQKTELQAQPQVIKKLTEKRSFDSLGTFTATAYDLSTESCEKPLGHPDYGITATGYSLAGQTWESARVIAVDPDIIPLGSKVYVSFEDESAKKYNGVYTAEDVGGAIKGYKFDFFMGDFNNNGTSKEARRFGVKKAELTLLRD